MNAAKLTSAFLLGLGVSLTSGSGAALADPPDDWCAPDSPYGNEVTGYLLEIQSWETHVMLEGDEEWHNVIIHENGTLDTHGHTLKVCGSLINYGEITDSRCGGYGKTGGAGGWGADPCDTPPGNPKPNECTPGGCDTGDPEPLCDGAGRGGDGSGGGGGGGGAMWPLASCQVDADGGNGGGGGKGGRGGGVVRIYAYRLNNHGVIQADGERGDDGGDGEDGEYWPWAGKDLAGGGGGGGAGGDGGNGGTVEVHYRHADSLNEEHIHASRGLRGDEGSGGDGHLCTRVTPRGREQSGCSGACGGGAGGDGEHQLGQSSGDGGNGDDGAAGVDGTVILDWDYWCDYDRANFDLLHYRLDLRIDPDTEWIGGTNIMEVECLVDGAMSLGFRLDQQRFANPVVEVSNNMTDWEALAWEWGGDYKTACALFDEPRNNGEVFYFRVAYEGNPQTVAGPLNGTEGMHFMDHGPEGEEVPIAYTTVSPWFAYLWWPVKDDGDNDNCDEATGEFYFEVPNDSRGFVVVSNGVAQAPYEEEPGWAIYPWVTDYNTPAYLFSVAVTNYVVAQPNPQSGITDIYFYLWPEDEPRFAHGRPDGTMNLHGKIEEFSKVVGMLGLFSNDEVEGQPDHPDARFGVYPFADEKYAIYQWPTGGGMEHQTATGLVAEWGEYKHFPTNLDIPLLHNFWTWFPKIEYQNAHELAHSWWGDLITPATWSHIWLSEGFASYGEAIWFETQYGRNDIPPFILPKEPLATLQRYMLINRIWSMVVRKLHDHVYCYDTSDPGEIYDYAVEYQKAPWVLHMLRHVVDPAYYDQDEKISTPRFFEILRTYRANQEDEGCATTDDFQAAAESVCVANSLYDDWDQYEGVPPGGVARNLDWFFGEPVEDADDGYGWIYGRGAPAYRYQRLLFCPDGHVCFRIHQTHPEWPQWSDEPLFTMPIDIDIRTIGVDEPTRYTVWNRAVSEQDYDIDVGPGVHWLVFDPDEWVLKRWAVPAIPGLVTDLGVAATKAPGQRGVRVNGLAQAAFGSQSGSGEERASLWLAERYYDLEHGLNDVGTLGGTWSAAYDINDAGQIVGDSEAAGGDVRAFIWLPEAAFGWEEAGMYELEAPAAVAGARGLNEDGQVVGYAGADAGHYHAVLWEYDPLSGLWDVVDLPTLGGDQSVAWAINNGFAIVGSSQTAGGETHAAIWQYDPVAEAWEIADIHQDGTYSVAYDVNDASQVVGSALVSSDTYAVLWQQSSAREHQEDYIAGPGSVAYGINDLGHIVGELNGRAHRWCDDEETDLNDYLASVTSCGELKAAWDINNAGLIVGYRETHVVGQDRVFVMDLSGAIDCNGNGVLDACDIALGSSEDADGNGLPDECQGPACACGDLDFSGGPVDLNDFAVLAICFALSAPTGDCDQTELVCSDLDASGTVDLNDFSTFAVLFGSTSTNSPPNCPLGAPLNPGESG